MRTNDERTVHTSRSLADTDPAVGEALDNEVRRQASQIELIASENVMSAAVREALGHPIGNKTLEGYPGRRFHGGGDHVDVIETLAIERAKSLFGAAYANVQPHSGTQPTMRFPDWTGCSSDARVPNTGWASSSKLGSEKTAI